MTPRGDTTTTLGPYRERADTRLRIAVVYLTIVEWLQQHHRVARLAIAAREFRSRLPAFALRGRDRECPCCGGRYKRMPRRLVTGWRDICPRCYSFSRHRLMALLLEGLDTKDRRILHFAPERSLDRVFARLPDVDRVTADLMAPADLRLDLTDLDLADGSFDLIICSHVLEHIPDDRAAMRELRRVLADGGLALILVPYSSGGLTFEDPAITGRLDRAVAYGQLDHVRRYGTDLGERLRQAGFAVEDRTASDLLDSATVERCVISPHEHVFLCRPGPC